MTARPTFVEREPYEKGFAHVFEREIVPRLDEVERERLARLKQTRLRTVAAVIGAVAVAGAMYAAGIEFQWIVFAAIGAAALAYNWARSPGTKHQADLRDVIAGPACRVLGGRDHGRLGNALAGFFKGMTRKAERIVFDESAFEKRYAVYTDDEAGARRPLAPGFLATMVALADTYDEKSLGAGFADGAFLLAIPIKGDLFEPGSLRRSAYDCQDDIHKFLGEITIAHRVIDLLHGEEPERAA